LTGADNPCGDAFAFIPLLVGGDDFNVLWRPAPAFRMNPYDELPAARTLITTLATGGLAQIGGGSHDGPAKS